MSFNDVAITYLKGSVYRIHFQFISKNDAVSITNNSNLIDKKGVLQIFFTIYKKLVRKRVIKETEM